MMTSSKVTNMLVGFVKAVITTYQSLSFVTASFTNIRANGYTPSTITVVTPYGQGSYPTGGLQGLLLPIEDSNKLYVNVGFAQTIPPIPYTFNPGESWSFSQNYVLTYQNSGMIAYRVNDESYLATLLSGQWANKIFQDLIADNNTTLRNYINEQINLFLTTHTHPGVTSGSDNTGPSALPVTNITTNTTLTDDNTAITNGNTLITDSGTTP